jgi:hypothetical protein
VCLSAGCFDARRFVLTSAAKARISAGFMA